MIKKFDFILYFTLIFLVTHFCFSNETKIDELEGDIIILGDIIEHLQGQIYKLSGGKQSLSYTSSHITNGPWVLRADYESAELIPEGDGKIIGKVLVDGKPVNNISIILLLDTNKRTIESKTNEEGTYEIPIREGKYFYNGWYLITVSFNEKLQGKILLPDTPKDLKYIEVDSKKPAQGPMISYATPVELINFEKFTPLGNYGFIEENSLTFRWKDYPNAKKYELQIVKAGRKWTSTFFTPLIEQKDITTNSYKWNNLKDLLIPDKLYGWKIIAYDNKGNKISESYDYNKFVMIKH